MSALAFVDIDGTLVFSPRAVARWDSAEPTAARYEYVDEYEGRAVGWVSHDTARLVRALEPSGMLVPTTARSVEQWSRMTLLHGVPQHAILAGGSAVFSGGVRDREWDAKLRGDREGTCATNEQMVDLLPGFAVSERDGSLLVIATRKDGEAAAVASGIRAEVEQNGWAVHADGRRVYLSPRVVSKAGAAQWIMDRQPADRAVAAGDSELDRALVEWADEALVPAHAVLASQPISSRNIRVTAHRGTAAAAEICEWLTGLVG